MKINWSWFITYKELDFLVFIMLISKCQKIPKSLK